MREKERERRKKRKRERKVKSPLDNVDLSQVYFILDFTIIIVNWFDIDNIVKNQIKITSGKDFWLSDMVKLLSLSLLCLMKYWPCKRFYQNVEVKENRNANENDTNMN